MPIVWKSFEEKEIIFRRGQLALISAGAGTGKSALTLAYALKAAVPTLYLSADSDAYTQLSRAVAMVTGWNFRAAQDAVLKDQLGPAEEALAGLPVRFNYLASPTLGDVETSVEAYDEVYGSYPDLVIVDNITNIRSGMSEEDGDPFAGLEGLLDYLHTMGRETQSCVAGLHHVTGPYNDGDKPIPMSGVKGQITRVPEMVLTMFRPGPGLIGVSPVKNRGGKNDPSGNTYAELEFDGDKMSLSDPAHGAAWRPPVVEHDEPGSDFDPDEDDPFLGD
ncbi:AAA family ATPase [Amycolatopsis sp.]|uniref:AAA family ATPase n=1 Tax=Amycolatopsis sp. TaxID=37632 RepID=UPI002B755ED3|nr:AAA family ATPase [Amycolatopsis sp.]HVV11607.1 AAA family ATPase [Amycolatopsis sp.]